MTYLIGSGYARSCAYAIANGVERLPKRSASLQTLLKMVDSHLWSGSWSPVLPSAVICSLGEALSSVIVLAHVLPRKECS